MKYTVLTESIGLFAKTIRSAKVYGPQNLKVYGLIEKRIRFFSGNYTVCESIRSSSQFIINESYDVKERKIYGPQGDS